MNRQHRPASHCRKGFTLVELTVIVVIIGVLAAFAIPRMLRSVERSKAAEAFSYLTAVRSAQERYQSLYGTYSEDLPSLDMELPIPKYFKIDKHDFHEGKTKSFEDSWKLRLDRTGSSGGYGQYRVTFNEDGYDPSESSIENFPEIIPISK